MAAELVGRRIAGGARAILAAVDHRDIEEVAEGEAVVDAHHRAVRPRQDRPHRHVLVERLVGGGAAPQEQLRLVEELRIFAGIVVGDLVIVPGHQRGRGRHAGAAGRDRAGTAHSGCDRSAASPPRCRRCGCARSGGPARCIRRNSRRERARRPDSRRRDGGRRKSSRTRNWRRRRSRTAGAAARCPPAPSSWRGRPGLRRRHSRTGTTTSGPAAGRGCRHGRNGRRPPPRSRRRGARCRASADRMRSRRSPARRRRSCRRASPDRARADRGQGASTARSRPAAARRRRRRARTDRRASVPWANAPDTSAGAATRLAPAPRRKRRRSSGGERRMNHR